MSVHRPQAQALNLAPPATPCGIILPSSGREVADSGFILCSCDSVPMSSQSVGRRHSRVCYSQWPWVQGIKWRVQVRWAQERAHINYLYFHGGWLGFCLHWVTALLMPALYLKTIMRFPVAFPINHSLSNKLHTSLSKSRTFPPLSGVYIILLMLVWLLFIFFKVISHLPRW